MCPQSLSKNILCRKQSNALYFKFNNFTFKSSVWLLKLKTLGLTSKNLNFKVCKQVPELYNETALTFCKTFAKKKQSTALNFKIKNSCKSITFPFHSVSIKWLCYSRYLFYRRKRKQLDWQSGIFFNLI